MKKEIGYRIGDASQPKTPDNKPVRTFGMAGKDGIFHPAITGIQENHLIVRHPPVQNPETACYA